MIRRKGSKRKNVQMNMTQERIKLYSVLPYYLLLISLLMIPARFVDASVVRSRSEGISAPSWTGTWDNVRPVTSESQVEDDDDDKSEENSSFYTTVCGKGQTCLDMNARNESFEFGGVNEKVEPSWYSRIGKFWKYVVLAVTSTVGPFYWDLLETAPILTKSVTACLIGGIGDATAQLFERSARVRFFDFRRIISVAAEGLLISGPLMHFVYEWMETVLPLEGEDDFVTWIYAMIHVVMDSVVLDCVFVATLMVFTGLLEGKINSIPMEFQTDFIPALKASWVSNLLFLPLEIAVFKFVPVKLRVLAINVQDIVWNAIVSSMAHRSRKHND